MDAAQIVVSKVEADRCFKVRKLLAESISQTRESAAHHPQRKVLAFDVGCAHEHGVRVSGDDLGYRLHKPGWKIARPPLWKMRVNLHELRVVHGIAECRIDGSNVRPPSVCCDLRA